MDTGYAKELFEAWYSGISDTMIREQLGLATRSISEETPFPPRRNINGILK